MLFALIGECADKTAEDPEKVKVGDYFDFTYEQQRMINLLKAGTLCQDLQEMFGSIEGPITSDVLEVLLAQQYKRVAQQLRRCKETHQVRAINPAVHDGYEDDNGNWQTPCWDQAAGRHKQLYCRSRFESTPVAGFPFMCTIHDMDKLTRLTKAEIDRLLRFLMCFVNADSIETYLQNCKDPEYKYSDKNKKTISSMRRQAAQEMHDNPVLGSGNVKEISDAVETRRKELYEETECISDNGRRKQTIESQMHGFKKMLIRDRSPSLSDY